MASERDLLFGLTALQTGLITEGAFVAACRSWKLDDTISLADHLASRGDLDDDDLRALETVVARGLTRRGSDAEGAIAALPGVAASTLEALASLGDPELTMTVGRLVSTLAAPLDEGRESQPENRSSTGGRRFRPIRPHARGGLGAVYVAVDEELNREVALKQLLDSHADNEASRQRFLIEAEVTGGLEHPGIVPVYGLGTYDDGRPYYAMRFIRGDTLKAAIEAFHADSTLKDDPGRKSLALRHLLRRFADVCNALDYAHGRGVLHRDIKPGNVIVGKHGETLVVDWGLAKAAGRLEPDASEASLIPASASGSAMTLPGSVLGTPAFMSPEQAAGELDRLDARSDVYSLGATLYNLLTGRSAFEGKLATVLQAVRGGDFSPPRAIDPAIDRALEAICLKAMAREPEGRYPTVRALAEDLERWTADEPISAREEGWSDRLSRWSRRHRSATRAAAVALLAIAATAAVAAVGINRAREATTLALDSEADARRVAEAQSRLALDAVRDYYTGVSRDFLLKQPELEDLRKSLLRSPLKFFDRMAATLASGPRIDRAMRVRLGETQYDLGRLIAEVDAPDASIPAFERALATQEALASERPDSADDQFRLSQTRLDLANKYDHAREPEKARVAFARVLDHCLLQAEAHPADRRFDTLRAEALQLRGDFLWDHNELTGARVDYEGSVRLGNSLVRAHPEDLVLGDKHASSLNNLSILYAMDSETRTQAQETLASSIALRERLVKQAPDDIMYRSNLSSSYQNQAARLHNASRPEDAMPWADQALKIQRELAEDQPNVGVFQERLGVSLGNLAMMEIDLHRLERALASSREAVEVKARLVRLRPGQVYPLLLLADEYATLAGIDQKLDSYDDGVEAAERGVERAREAVALDPSRHDLNHQLATNLVVRADLLRDAGRTLRPIADAAESVAIERRLAREFPEVDDYERHLGMSLSSLVVLLKAAGRAEEAEAVCREAIAVIERTRPGDPRSLAPIQRLVWLHAHLGDLLGRRGRADEAFVAYRKGLDLRDEGRKEATDDPDLADAGSFLLAWRADLLARLGRASEALKDDALALEIAPAKNRRVIALRRAANLALAGNPDAALRAAPDQERGEPLDGETTVRLAAVYARCASARRRGDSPGLAEEAEFDADRAMDLLREARSRRIYRDPIRLRAELDDPSFDSLRARDDFRSLSADLGFPADPFASNTGSSDRAATAGRPPR